MFSLMINSAFSAQKAKTRSQPVRTPCKEAVSVFFFARAQSNIVQLATDKRGPIFKKSYSWKIIGSPDAVLHFI